MNLKLLVALALLVPAMPGAILAEKPQGQTSVTPSPSSANGGKKASFHERLAAAKSVKVRTDILGIEIDSSFTAAHAKLDPLSVADSKSKPEDKDAKGEEEEEKAFWKLTKSDYDSVFIKADRQDRVTYILGSLKPGKQISFREIGEIEKAPIHNDNMVAWDVVRPNRPLIRVVARGRNSKADSITIFFVKRPPKR